MKTLRVELGERSYDIYVGHDIVGGSAGLIPWIEEAERIAIIEDPASFLAGLYGLVEEIGRDRVAWAEVHGEADKTAAAAERLWRWLAREGFHRGDLVLAHGGGATTDLAGYVAATFNRGLGWVAMPTTLLAMVDAAIGGKTAIDLPEGKNLVGSFHQPRAVIADVSQLRDLPAEHLCTGMAEVIKHGLIADADLLSFVERAQPDIDARDVDTLEQLVADAAAIKVNIVSQDETEQGARAHLNYGHTLGHAIEALDNYTGRTHGQAIGIGMMFAAHLAVALGMKDRVSEHKALFELFGLPTKGAAHEYEAIAEVWQRDKKYDKGVRFVLLEDLGKPVVTRDIPEDALRAAYEAVR
ncbi:MAG: 3-dehydroquinate synthase [Actinomycetota bacterium]